MASDLLTIFRSSRPSIPAVSIDVMTNENHVAENKVTSLPIETGSPLSNHVILEPDIVELSFVVTNYDGPFGGGADGERARTAWQQMKAYRKSRELLTITTKHEVYNDMVIESLNGENMPGFDGSIRVTVRFKQVNIINLSASGVTESTLSSDIAKTASDLISAGQLDSFTFNSNPALFSRIALKIAKNINPDVTEVTNAINAFANVIELIPLTSSGSRDLTLNLVNGDPRKYVIKSSYNNTAGLWTMDIADINDKPIVAGRSIGAGTNLLEGLTTSQQIPSVRDYTSVSGQEEFIELETSTEDLQAIGNIQAIDLSGSQIAGPEDLGQTEDSGGVVVIAPPGAYEELRDVLTEGLPKPLNFDLDDYDYLTTGQVPLFIANIPFTENRLNTVLLEDDENQIDYTGNNTYALKDVYGNYSDVTVNEDNITIDGLYLKKYGIFDGSSYVSYSSSVFLDDVSNFKGRFVINFDALATGTNTIVSQYNLTGADSAFSIEADPAYGFRVLITGSGDYGSAKDYRTTSSVLSGIQIFSFEFISGTLKLFINNIEVVPNIVAEDSFTTMYDSSLPVFVGCKADSGGPVDFYTGDIYELELKVNDVSILEPLFEYNMTNLKPLPSYAYFGGSAIYAIYNLDIIAGVKVEADIFLTEGYYIASHKGDLETSWGLYIDGGYLYAEVSGPETSGSTTINTKLYQSDSVINSSEITTVGFEFSNSVLRLLVNGVQIATNKLIDETVYELKSNGIPVVIGGRYSSIGNGFEFPYSGGMTNVKIWKNPLNGLPPIVDLPLMGDKANRGTSTQTIGDDGVVAFSLVSNSAVFEGNTTSYMQIADNENLRFNNNLNVELFLNPDTNTITEPMFVVGRYMNSKSQEWKVELIQRSDDGKGPFFYLQATFHGGDSGELTKKAAVDASAIDQSDEVLVNVIFESGEIFIKYDNKIQDLEYFENDDFEEIFTGNSDITIGYEIGTTDDNCFDGKIRNLKIYQAGNTKLDIPFDAHVNDKTGNSYSVYSTNVLVDGFLTPGNYDDIETDLYKHSTIDETGNEIDTADGLVHMPEQINQCDYYYYPSINEVIGYIGVEIIDANWLGYIKKVATPDGSQSNFFSIPMIAQNLTQNKVYEGQFIMKMQDETEPIINEDIVIGISSLDNPTEEQVRKNYLGNGLYLVTFEFTVINTLVIIDLSSRNGTPNAFQLAGFKCIEGGAYGERPINSQGTPLLSEENNISGYFPYYINAVDSTPYASFDGSSYIDYGTPKELIIGTNTFEIEIEINPENLTVDPRPIVSKGTTGSLGEWIIYKENDTLYFNSNNILYTPVVISKNIFQTVKFVFDGVNITSFKNDIQQYQEPFSENLNSTKKFLIGCDSELIVFWLGFAKNIKITVDSELVFDAPYGRNFNNITPFNNEGFFNGSSYLDFDNPFELDFKSSDFEIKYNQALDLLPPSFLLPMETDSTNWGTNTGVVEGEYISTTRQSVIDKNGKPVEIDAGVEIIDGTEVETIGEFHGNGDSLIYSNTNNMNPLDSDFYMIFGVKTNIQTQQFIQVKGDRGYYSRINANGTLSLLTSDDGVGFTLATSTGVILNDNIARCLKIAKTGTLVSFFYKIYEGNCSDSDWLSMGTDLAVNSIYPNTTDFRISTYPSFSFQGEYYGFLLNIENEDIIDVTFQGSFKNHVDNSEPVKIGNPTLLGISHLSGENSQGYAPQVGSRENLIVDSEEPDDETPTVLNATEYTLSVKEGQAIITGVGNATPTSPLTFTTTSTLIPILFVGGTKYVNLELGDTVTRWIATHGTPYTVLSTSLKSPASVLNVTNGSIVSKVELVDSCNIFDSANGFSLSYNSGDFTLQSSTGNSVIISTTIPIAEINKIAVRWSGDVFDLVVNTDLLLSSQQIGNVVSEGLIFGADWSESNPLKHISNIEVYDTVIDLDKLIIKEFY